MRVTGGQLKYLLLLCALGISVYVYKSRNTSGHELASASAKGNALTGRLRPEDLERKTLERPRFTSHDKQGNPFQVLAARARELGDEVVEVLDPEATMHTAHGARWVARAHRGRLDRHQPMYAVLEDDVVIQEYAGDSDLRIVTPQLVIDLQKNTITSDYPLSGTSTYGAFQCQAFTLRPRARTVCLRGPVHMVFQEAST